MGSALSRLYKSSLIMIRLCVILGLCAALASAQYYPSSYEPYPRQHYSYHPQPPVYSSAPSYPRDQYSYQPSYPRDQYSYQPSYTRYPYSYQPSYTRYPYSYQPSYPRLPYSYQPSY